MLSYWPASSVLGQAMGLEGSLVSAMSGYLALTLFIGAAVRDASPAQLKRLRAEVLPKAHALANKEVPRAQVDWLIRSMLTTTVDIMGDDWRLDPEMSRAITMFTRRGDGQ